VREAEGANVPGVFSARTGLSAAARQAIQASLVGCPWEYAVEVEEEDQSEIKHPPQSLSHFEVSASEKVEEARV
jgi:hypothetical protein